MTFMDMSNATLRGASAPVTLPFGTSLCPPGSDIRVAGSTRRTTPRVSQPAGFVSVAGWTVPAARPFVPYSWPTPGSIPWHGRTAASRPGRGAPPWPVSTPFFSLPTSPVPHRSGASASLASTSETAGNPPTFYNAPPVLDGFTLYPVSGTRFFHQKREAISIRVLTKLRHWADFGGWQAISLPHPMHFGMSDAKIAPD